MFRTLFAITTSCALAVGGSAAAGEPAKVELSALKGAVSVSQGGRIAPARAGALKPGDRVIARDGEAKLTYGDGCVVTLKSRSMATISETSPCADGPGLIAGGLTSAQISEMTPFRMVMAVLAVGGLVYGIGSLIDNASNDDPVSP